MVVKRHLNWNIFNTFYNGSRVLITLANQLNMNLISNFSCASLQISFITLMKLQLIKGEHESICENGNLLESSQTASESAALSCSQDDCGPLFEEQKSVKDNCWSWLICAASFCELFIVLGTHYSFGILYSALLDKFGESKAATGLYWCYMYIALFIQIILMPLFTLGPEEFNLLPVYRSRLNYLE